MCISTVNMTAVWDRYSQHPKYQVKMDSLLYGKNRFLLATQHIQWYLDISASTYEFLEMQASVVFCKPKAKTWASFRYSATSWHLEQQLLAFHISLTHLTNLFKIFYYLLSLLAVLFSDALLILFFILILLVNTNHTSASCDIFCFFTIIYTVVFRKYHRKLWQVWYMAYILK